MRMLRRGAPVKKGPTRVAAGLSMCMRIGKTLLLGKMFMLSWVMVEEFKA